MELMTGVVVDCEPVIVEFENGKKTIQRVALYFKNNKFFIMAESKKITGKLLYNSLLMHGVSFNSYIPIKKIQEYLYSHFAPRMINAKNKITIPATTGWHERKFYSAENFMLNESDGIPPLPIQKKSYGNIRIQR